MKDAAMLGKNSALLSDSNTENAPIANGLRNL